MSNTPIAKSVVNAAKKQRKHIVLQTRLLVDLGLIIPFTSVLSKERETLSDYEPSMKSNERISRFRWLCSVYASVDLQS